MLIIRPIMSGVVECRWEDAKLVLMRDNFFSELVYFDKSQLSAAAARRLAEYCSSPAFTPESVYHCSVAAAGLCQWLRALHSYVQKHDKLQPLVERLVTVERESKQVSIYCCFLSCTICWYRRITSSFASRSMDLIQCCSTEYFDSCLTCTVTLLTVMLQFPD